MAYLKTVTTLLKIIITLIIVPGSNSCYTHYSVVNSEPFQRFSLPPGNQCWDYCKVLENCLTFIISLDQLSECSLHKERVSELDSHTDIESLDIILDKRCIFQRTTRDSEETIKLSQETGLVIQNADTGLCVEVNITGYGGLNSKGPMGYPLVWSSACDQTWELRSVTTDEQSVSYDCKKTSVQLKNTNMCITLLNWVGWVLPKAFLQTCKSAEETEEQILLLCSAVSDLERDRTWSLMQYLPRYSSIALGSPISTNHTTTLSRVRLSTGDELKDPTAACRDVKAENGRALLDLSVPVFLPGERITVECDEGFGVRGDNETYDNSYTTTCSEHMDLDRCSPLPKKREQRCSNHEDFEKSRTSDRDLGTFLLVIVRLTLFLDH